MAAMCTDMHADGFEDIVNIFLVTLSVCLLQKKGGEGTKYKMLLLAPRDSRPQRNADFSSITAEASWRDKFGQIWDKYRLA